MVERKYISSAINTNPGTKVTLSINTIFLGDKRLTAYIMTTGRYNATQSL